MTYPKIELHVHLEGTVRAGTLLQIARRNGVGLPADSAEGLADLYQYRDFRHFIEVWGLTTCALRTADDFRQVVVDYAAEAASHGAVYLEGIFTPAEPVGRGAAWDEVFEGYCDGAQEARELHGVHVRLTPEIARGYPIETAARVVLDVTPISNLRTGAVASLAEHPLPELVTAGVSCSVSTDDPAMFGLT
jgi:aminodeoxyfutalosine deaminase